MTPPIRPSVFFEGSEASSLTRRQSGRMEEKILACFTWPHMITSVMPSALQDVDQLAELRRARSSGSGRPALRSRGEASSWMAMTVTSWPEAPRAFEREEREAAVAGDEPVRASTSRRRARRRG